MSSIRVELQLKDGSFVSGVVRAGQTIKQFQNELARTDKHFDKISKSSRGFITSVKKADDSTRTLLGTMRDISLVSGAITLAFGAITGAAGGFIGDIIKINAEMERLRYQMMGMSTASDPIREAGQNVAYLREQATKMPFSLKEISTTFVKLKATGLDPAAGSMQALADGIAAFGGTDEQLHRVTLGVTQMMGKSVIQMEEMRQQLGESMPNAMQIMARSMGVSVAELNAAIATGTVEARTALNKFYEELDRTYGGAAQRMMGSFSGQVTQLKANLQLLATGEGMSGFFEAQKAALVELNEFLKSDRAKVFAKSMGDALGAVVRGLTRAAEMAYEFRSEIMMIGKIVAVTAGVRGLIAALGTMRASLALARVEVVAFNTTMAASSGHFAAGIASMVRLGVTARGTTLVMGGLRGMLLAVGAGLTTFAPYIVLIGAALGLAASKMGLFGDKTKKAYEDLKSFGAESRQQAEEILNNREEELKAEIARARSAYRWDFNRPENKLDKKAAIDRAEAELAEFLERRKTIMARAEAADSKRAIEAYNDELEEKGRASQQAYQEEQVMLDRRYAEEQAKAAESGESLTQIRERYQKNTLENQKRLSQSMIDIYDAEIANLTTQIKGASGYRLREIEDMLTLLRAKRMEAQGEMNALGNFGIDTLEPPENIEKKVEKGRKLLDSLKDDIAGLEADMAGAASATAKLNMQIARGDYGSVEEGGEAVKKLHEELVAATEQKEALDRLMKGRSKAEADLEKIRLDILEKEMEIKEKMAGGDLNDAERFKLRLDNGYYEGLGPIENIRKAVNNVVDALVLQGDTQTEVARSMREDAFSDFTVTKIDNVAGALGRVVDMVGLLNSGLSSTSFDKFGLGLAGTAIPIGAGSGDAKRAMEFFMGRGYSSAQASGIVGNLLAESGLSTTIKGDGGKAQGVAQWHPDRWNNLLKFAAVHKADPYALDTQLAFVDWELKNKETGAYSNLMAAQTVYQATAAFAGYERPSGWSAANPAGAHNFGTRLGYATTLAGGDYGASAPLGPMPTGFSAKDIKERQSKLESDAVAFTEKLRAQAAEYIAKFVDLEALEKSLTAQKYLEDLKAKAEGAKVETEELGANYAKLVELVQKGEFGASRNIADYKDLADAAKRLDDVEKNLKKTREAARAAEGQQKDLEKQRLEITQKLADERERAKDPDYQGDSDALRKLNEQLDDYLANVRTAYGEDSAEYRRALDEKTAMLKGHRQLEAVSRQADLEAEKRDLEESMMSQGQVRRRALDRQLKAIDDWAAKAREAGLAEIEITEFVESQKALIREKYARDENPVTVQMKEWGDAAGRLMEQTTGWLDGFASGMTDILTGKGTGGLKSAIDGMLNDVVSSAFKYLYSTNFGSKTANIAGKGLGPAAGGKKAIAHSGGIIGSLKRTHRSASFANFIGAPRYHTGGIIGNALLPSEQPIIARKGEGVFTPEQMKALAPAGTGGMQVSISAPVTVNGSAGTPEQNDDLAGKIARDLEGTMRGVVVDELRRQMRPGNMIGNMGRR